MLSQEPTTFLPCIRRRRYAPMKRKVEAQEMGQRHRFSSGVKSPSSPFGHFCFASWTSGSCIQCVQSLRHVPQAATRRDSNPRSKIRLSAKDNTRKQPVCGGCSSTPNAVISHLTCKLVDLFYDGAAHAFSYPSTHSPNITCCPRTIASGRHGPHQATTSSNT